MAKPEVRMDAGDVAGALLDGAFTPGEAVDACLREARRNSRVGVKCQECGKRFKTASSIPECPRCHGVDVEVDEGWVSEQTCTACGGPMPASASPLLQNPVCPRCTGRYFTAQPKQRRVSEAFVS